MSPSVEARVAAATAELARQRATKEDNKAQIQAERRTSSLSDLHRRDPETERWRGGDRYWLRSSQPESGSGGRTSPPPTHHAELSEAVEGLASVVWGMAEHRREMGFKTYTWEDRRNDAILYLALGDDNATPLRQRIWINDGVRWSLSPEVIEAATTMLATSPGDPLLYPDLRDATSHPPTRQPHRGVSTVAPGQMPQGRSKRRAGETGTTETGQIRSKVVNAHEPSYFRIGANPLPQCPSPW